MKKIYLLLLTLICSAATWATDVVIDRTNWTITAYCNPTGAIEGDASGLASAAIDGSTSTYFHSAWTWAPDNQNGYSDPQALQIDMADDQTISKIAFTPRANGAGAPLTYRIYVSDTSIDLTALTEDTKATALSDATLSATLGTAVSGTWTDDATVKEATINKTGRYILFIADTRHTSDQAWFCCAEFNAYKDVTTYDVTYNFLLNGAKKGSTTIAVEANTAYPTPTLPTSSYYSSDFYTLTGIPTGNVTANATVDLTLTQNLPFTPSSNFDAATWYTMTIDANKHYLYYSANATSIALNRTTTEYADSDQFCFIGNILDGFTIYNKAAGSNKVLSSPQDSSHPYDGNTGGSTYVTLQDAGTASTCQLWDVTKSSDISNANGFYLSMHAYTANIRMNNRGDILAFWNSGAGAGSTFLVTEVSESAARITLKDAIAEANTMIGSTVGLYPQTAIDAAQAVYDNTSSTDAQCTTATTTLKAARVMPTSGKIYMIVNAYPGYLSNQSVEKAVYDNSGTSSWKTLDGSDMTMYWYIQPDAAGTGYTIKNYSTNNYLSDYAATSTTETSWYLKGLAVGTYGYEFGLTKDATFSDYYGFLHTGGHSSGAGVSGNTTYWSTGADGASSWYIREVSDPNLNAAIAALQNKVDSCNAYIYGTNPGYYSASDSTTVKNAVKTAQAVLDSGATTAITYTNALSTLTAAVKAITTIPISAGKYFILNAKPAFNKGKALTAEAIDGWYGGNKTPGWEDWKISNPEEVWTLIADGDNFKLYNAWTSKYISACNAMTTEETSAKAATFTSVGKGQFTITLSGSTAPFHANLHSWTGSADICEYDGGVDSPSAWYLVSATDEQETSGADSTLATIQGVDKITLVDGATVISPSEFDAPSKVNAAIDAVDAISSSATVATMGAAYVANQAIINNYRNAITSYGALLSITYTPVKGWNTISLPINWSCPDGWYRFNCDSLKVGSDTLSVSSCSGTKNTPMLIYSNNTDTYQFIGYSNGANDSVNVSKNWLTGIMVADDNKTIVSDTTTAYVIDAANQTITKATTATAVDLYHCYILADKVLDYTTLHFPACNTTALKSALETANSYTSLIDEGLGKYTETTSGSLAAAITEGDALTGATDYSQQVAIDTAVVHLNKAINGLTINQPETGKYYRFKSQYNSYFNASESTSKINSQSSTPSANNIFYLDENNKLLSYSRGLYVTSGTGNYSAVTMADADSANISVLFTKGNIIGTYNVKRSDANVYLYDWTTYDPSQVLVTSDNSHLRNQWTIEQVDSLPLSLTKVGDNAYATLYLPVEVEFCGDSIEAYAATVSESTMTMKSLADYGGGLYNDGLCVPANRGVMLVSDGCTSGVVKINYVPVWKDEDDEVSELDDENVLTGTIYSTHQENATNQNPYVFGIKSGALGFYRLTAGKALTGGRAYYDPEKATSVNGFKLNFEEEETAIEQLQDKTSDSNAALYDLSGRRVLKANKGIYIKNDKKYIAK